MKHSLLVFVFQVPLFLFGAIPQHSDEYYAAIKPEVREAQRKGANAKIIYRVVDDEGIAVSNVTLLYNISDRKGDLKMTQKQSARKFVEYWTFQRGSEKVNKGAY